MSPRTPRTRAAPPGVVHVTAEYWPLARTGGLGEAVAGLAAYQAAAGTPTTVVLPLYRIIRDAGVPLRAMGGPFEVAVGPHRSTARLWRLTGARAPRVVLVESHDDFGRHGIYGEGGADYPDNARRFALLSLAVLHRLGDLAKPPVVLHAHDWHAALLAVYLRTTFAGRDGYDAAASVVAVHNGGFQGHFPPETLPDIGVAPELYHPGRFEWYGRANLLKAGLTFADGVVTVSPSHARELCTGVGGFGLHDVFQGLGDRLTGIRNGIDQAIWDPAADPDIPARYGAASPDGKRRCKSAVQHAYGLPERADVPVVAMSSRLVSQKGLDLLLDGDPLLRIPAQFVFLGAGEHRYETALRALATHAPDRVAVEFGFTDEREHRLLAGADILLMPSLYEPCGLTQMRGQRYGTLPVARAVGGLADTIDDERTGFLFHDYSAAALEEALGRAVTRFHDTGAWAGLMREAMARDFGWGPSVAQYDAAYRRALAQREAVPA